jgi:hypothetical protein
MTKKRKGPRTLLELAEYVPQIPQLLEDQAAMLKALESYCPTTCRYYARYEKNCCNCAGRKARRVIEKVKSHV